MSKHLSWRIRKLKIGFQSLRKIYKNTSRYLTNTLTGEEVITPRVVVQILTLKHLKLRENKLPITPYTQNFKLGKMDITPWTQKVSIAYNHPPCIILIVIAFLKTGQKDTFLDVSRIKVLTSNQIRGRYPQAISQNEQGAPM